MKNKTKDSCTLFIEIASLIDATWKGDINLPPNQTYYLEVDYPLDTTYKFKINTGKNGMSLVPLMKKIGEIYKGIYQKPDKYGIWGHHITDLALEGIDVNHDKKVIKLFIGS
jgi:hypothetical protein